MSIPAHIKLAGKRKHWGDLIEGVEPKREIKASELVSAATKLEQLRKLQIVKPPNRRTTITMDNPIVTQTIEVMNQTEGIQSLIDTYTSNNSGAPSQLMPHIDFPPDVMAQLVRDDKFLKPLWYIPPERTDFTRGVPIKRAGLTKPVVMEALRKSISGLLRLKGFYEATDSSLIMLTDGVDEFFKSFLQCANDVLANQGRDVQKCLDVATLQTSYFALNGLSLTALHNYYKHEIVQRNRVERTEFQEIFQEYDRLMKQSQDLHKDSVKQEDYMNMIDYTGTPGSSTTLNQDDQGGIMNYHDGSDHSNTGSCYQTTTTFEPYSPIVNGGTTNTTFDETNHTVRYTTQQID